MLQTLSDLVSEQSKPMVQMVKPFIQFLNYCDTNSDAGIFFKSSEMLLKVHTDVSYLFVAKGRSRAGGHFYLGNCKI